MSFFHFILYGLYEIFLFRHACPVVTQRVYYWGPLVVNSR